MTKPEPTRFTDSDGDKFYTKQSPAYPGLILIGVQRHDGQYGAVRVTPEQALQLAIGILEQADYAASLPLPQS